ncbi:G-protein coupled receptor [Branchiostoma belcheri]|nr:G-protein coupled receptor [Branchiostoma belcheri]
MNDSLVNLTQGNSTAYETFWPCVQWRVKNELDYNLALAACSQLPDPLQIGKLENRKIGIASAVVGAASILLNGAVLSGIFRNHQLTEPMYMFVANLAVADCVAAVGVVLLSMDRYLAILHPIFYKTRVSDRHVAVSLGIAWPVCAIVCLSPLMGWNCMKIETENCVRNLPDNYLRLINIILAVAVVVVVFVNVRIFIVLKQRFSRVGLPEQHQEDLPAAQQQLKLKLKTAVTVVAIAALFIIIWLPIFVHHLPRQRRVYDKTATLLGLLIGFCGSVVNPFIYASRLEKIRQALLRRSSVRHRSLHD